MKSVNQYIKIISALYFLLLVNCMSSAQNFHPANQLATQETIDLYNSLFKIAETGIMFGHQDDLAYGVKWKYIEGESDIKRVVGDYPAVFGWDLGNIENKSEVNLDSVPFKKLKQFIVDTYNKRGINTISWHAWNPITGGNTWDTETKTTVHSILPGGEYHDKYVSWLDILAQFFQSLKNNDGKLVPVIFRPFHEFSGSWFWWGNKYCTSQEFIQLWQFTFDYLTKTKNVNNILFCFSSSGDFKKPSEYLEKFPGENYVDIIGFDTYQFSGMSNKVFTNHLKSKLKILDKLAEDMNKPSALTETGYEQIPDSTWWTAVLWNGIQNSNISYVLLWRNANEKNKKNHYYVPFPGQISEKNFVEFEKLEQTLFLKDLNK